jgi:hypothetical protein
MPLFSLFRGLFEWRCGESHPSRAGPAKSRAQAHHCWANHPSTRPTRCDEARRSRRASTAAAPSYCCYGRGTTTSHAARRSASRHCSGSDRDPCPRRCR